MSKFDEQIIVVPRTTLLTMKQMRLMAFYRKVM